MEPVAYQLLLAFISASLVLPVSTLSHPTPGKLASGQTEMAAAPLWCLVGIIGEVGFEATEVFQVPGGENSGNRGDSETAELNSICLGESLLACLPAAIVLA